MATIDALARVTGEAEDVWESETRRRADARIPPESTPPLFELPKATTQVSFTPANGVEHVAQVNSTRTLLGLASVEHVIPLGADPIRDAAPTLVDEPWFDDLNAPEDEESTMDAPQSLAPRSWLGRYELLMAAKLGVRGTWLARQYSERGFTKLVALVAIPGGSTLHASCGEIMSDDARAAASLHHPNVCELLELGEHGSTVYVATEWVHGVSLAEIVRPEGRSPQPIAYAVAAHVVARAADGLHAAHEIGADDDRAGAVVHRHLTLHNVLISAIGHVKVAGVGTARAASQLEASETCEHTRAYPSTGRLASMAPEVVAGGAFDRRSDVFSLGAVLYEATTGRAPFAAPNERASMDALLRGEYPRPSAFIADYPAELEAIIVRALERDPLRRFPTADAMRVTLDQWLVQSRTHVDMTHVMNLAYERAGGLLGSRGNVVREFASGAAGSGVRQVVTLVTRRPSDRPEPPVARHDTDNGAEVAAFVNAMRRRDRVIRWGLVGLATVVTAALGFAVTTIVTDRIDALGREPNEIVPAAAVRPESTVPIAAPEAPIAAPMQTRVVNAPGANAPAGTAAPLPPSRVIAPTSVRALAAPIAPTSKPFASGDGWMPPANPY
jgi:serine/threonine-protein kinase